MINMSDIEDYLLDGFLIIGNKNGVFKTFKKDEPSLYFDISLDKYNNIKLSMEDNDSLIIYHNKLINRYIVCIVNRSIVKKPRIIMEICAKVRHSSYELYDLLDTMCLKLRNDKIYNKKIDREKFTKYFSL